MISKKTPIIFIVIIVLTAVTTLLTVFLGVINYTAYKKHKFARMYESISNNAGHCAHLVATPLLNKNWPQLDLAIESMMSNRNIYGIMVTGSEKSRGMVRDAHWNAIPSCGVPVLPELLKTEHPIIYLDRTIGRLTIYVTSKLIEEETRNDLIALLFAIACFNGVIIITIYFLLKRLVITPLKDVERYAALSSSNSKEHKKAELKDCKYYGELDKIRTSIVKTVQLFDIRNDAVKESESKYRKIFNSTNDAVITFGVDIRGGALKFIEANDMAYKRLGYEHEELLQKSLGELIWRDDTGVLLEMHKNMAMKIKNAFETSIAAKNGEQIPVEIKTTGIELGGEPAILFIVRDITERKRAVEALRRTSAKFSHMFNTNPVAIAVIHASDNKILDINDAMSDVFGYSRAEAVGHTVLELGMWDNPEDMDEACEMLFREGKVRNREYAFRIKGNRRILCKYSADLVEFLGERCIQVSIVDLTESKMIEKALRESEKKYSGLFASVSAGIVISRISDGHILEANLEFERIFGYTRKDIIGSTSFELMLWLDMKEREQVINMLNEGKPVRDLELHFKAKDGKLLILHYTAEIIELHGNKYLLSVLTDANELARLQKELQENELRYKRIEEKITDYIFAVHIVNGEAVKTEHTPNCKRITGYGVAEFKADPFLWINIVPAEERESVRRHAAIVESGVNPGTIEHRIIRKDGAIRWVLSTPNLSFNPKGKLVSCEWVVKDITESKIAMESIRKSELQMREISSKMLLAREDEKKKVSVDLHDEAGSLAIIFGLHFGIIKEFVMEGKYEQAVERLNKAHEDFKTAVSKLKKMSFEMLPPDLEMTGIGGALESYVNMIKRYFKLEITLSINCEGINIQQAVLITIYRICQESLNNIISHSKAKNVKITLQHEDNTIFLRIKDDGHGFNIKDAASNPTGFGIGLKGIAERVNAVGGEYKIISSKGAGTEIAVKIPIESVNKSIA